MGLETQTRAEWDALKLDLLKAHLQHAYEHSPYYRASFDAAVVDRVNHLDRLTVELERGHDFTGTDDDLAERFGLGLKALTGLSGEVRVLPPGSLPRATHKGQAR